MLSPVWAFCVSQKSFQVVTAAPTGNKSTVQISEADRNKSIERLPRELLARLKKSEAKAMAEQLIKDGNDEGAIILYALEEDIRNEADTPEGADAPQVATARILPGAQSIRDASQRGYPPAMVERAIELANTISTDSNKITNEDRANAAEVWALYTAAARQGFSVQAARRLLVAAARLRS